MSDESKLALRGTKCANIILSLCEMYNLSMQEATDIYYQSELSQLIEDGVADLQCRSDKYLAQCVWEEHTELLSTNNQN